MALATAMALALRRVNLMLDDGLVESLQQEARRQHTSMSDLARTLLPRQLRRPDSPAAALSRIRKLRTAKGPMPNSTETIRRERDRGW